MIVGKKLRVENIKGKEKTFGGVFAVRLSGCFKLLTFNFKLAVVGTALLAFNVKPASAAVVLNEVVYDPSGSDTGLEWIELYNNGSSAVDLAGWTIQLDQNGVWTDTTTSVSATLAGLIAPQSFFLIEDTQDASKQPADLLLPVGDTLGMGNASSKAEGLRLLNAAGAEVDRLVYGSPDSDGIGAEGGAGAEAPNSTSGGSLARVSDGRDTQNNFADFQSDPSPTPREPNDPSGLVRTDYSGTISYPNPFFPRVHGTVTLSTPERIMGPLRDIRIYDETGELVRLLQAPQWDGRNDDGEFVASGLYFYVVQTELGKSRGKVTLIR